MEFVSFEIAKKLKEKGFDEECLAYYTSEYTLYLNTVVLCDDKYLDMAEIDYEECLRSYNTQKDRWLRTLVDAPTISQVLKWLRVEKQIYIIPESFPCMATNNKICWSYKFKWNSDGVYMDSTYPDDSSYTTYEQAALAGIKYILDNFDQFKNLCYKSIDNRQREDDLAPYRNTGPSTSRDPDSEEWRKG